MLEPRYEEQTTRSVHAFRMPYLGYNAEDMNTLFNVDPIIRDIDSLKCNGVTPIAPPESSTDGETTKSALLSPESQIEQQDLHWYVMRATYGRERKAYEYIISKGTEAFYPTSVIKKKDRDGKMTLQKVSLLPNLFFIHTTEEIAKIYAYDKKDLHYLRFYYNQHHDGTKEPLIVPDSQIQNLRIVCSSQAEDILVAPLNIPNFQAGQRVRVIEGDFKGIVGIVSRWHGQQRVGITLQGLCIIATAYVPSAFLEVI